MRLAVICTYPIKGGYRLEHHSATVEPWGIAGDRRWLVVDPDGKFLTQRDEPRLTSIRPAHFPGGLRLSANGMEPVDVARPFGGELLAVRIWRDTVHATLAAAPAADWLSKALQRDVALVYLDDPLRRAVNPEYGRPDDRVSFADGYPLLLTSTASLDAVNDWLGESGNPEAPLPMNRFRPNVVVSGAPAWAEDDWIGRRIRIGGVTLRVVKPCDRCVVTTTDQETGERGHEPLFVLAKHRRTADGLVFGVNMIPDSTGGIAVGDPVSVLDEDAEEGAGEGT